MQFTRYLKMVAGSAYGLLACFHVEEQRAGSVVNEHGPVRAVADHQLSGGIARDSPRRRQVRSEARHQLAARRKHLVSK